MKANGTTGKRNHKGRAASGTKAVRTLFRKEVGVERHFRDARAATVMAPTTDALYDFIGKALCGIPLFG
jgi:alkylation response protein AidB-like acyl-CoA dehydrogenase